MTTHITSFQQVSPSLSQPVHGQTPQTVSADTPVRVLSYYHATPSNSFLSRCYAPLPPSCSLQTTQTFAGTVQLEADATLTFDRLEREMQYIPLIYSLRNGDKVLKFLKEHLFLVSVLIEARSYISQYFSNSAIFLDIETDPEERDSEQLVALVETDASPEEAYRKLKQFNEDWWLEVIARTQMKLCISVEFK